MPFLIDLTGQTFARLTVISRVSNNRHGHPCWHCRCTCGNTTIVEGAALRGGHTKSCGCLVHEPIRQNLIGQTFGRLTVIDHAPDGPPPHRRRHWLCRCKCGKTKIVAADDLKSRNTRSCRCLASELLIQSNSAPNSPRRIKIKHGAAQVGKLTPEYRIWRGIRQRTRNPQCPAFKYYGGRGITMCDEWLNSFAAFFAHVGPKPSPKHSIDRIDVNGHYEPGNVRWATQSEQLKNRRKIGSLTLFTTQELLAELKRRTQYELKQ